MEKYIHKVKYYECDRMGITHHSNYVRFMEEARIDALDQLGYGFEKMEAEGIVSPVVAISCEYKRTTTFQDQIEIEVKTLEMSPLKLKFGYTMTVGGKLVFKGESLHCFLGANGRPIVLEETHPGLYQGLKELMEQ